MPYNLEHSCRLTNPDKYKRFTRKNCGMKHGDKCIDMVLGWQDKNGKEVSEMQAMRYPKDIWTESSAKSHCKSHDGSFEAAKKEKSMKENIEYRDFEIDELRAVGGKDNEPMKFVGYMAPFGPLSQDLGGFRERIRPGAFNKSIQSDDIRALFNHRADYVLGRTTSGTLELREDDKGLLMTVQPPEAQWVNDLAASIRRKDITGGSFGFRSYKDSWEEDKVGNKTPIRTLEEIGLIDVSIVTFPAYKDTKVAIRSEAEVEVGIDINSISRVMIKKCHDLEINDEDCAAINATIDALRSILPESFVEKEPDPKETPELKHRIVILRKKLELKEKSIGG